MITDEIIRNEIDKLKNIAYDYSYTLNFEGHVISCNIRIYDDLTPEKMNTINNHANWLAKNSIKVTLKIVNTGQILAIIN